MPDLRIILAIIAVLLLLIFWKLGEIANRLRGDNSLDSLDELAEDVKAAREALETLESAEFAQRLDRIGDILGGILASMPTPQSELQPRSDWERLRASWGIKKPNER